MSQPLIALFVVVGVGLTIGTVRIWGLSLGSSGVLFSALLAGHMGFGLPPGIGTFGLVLFVYCVGIGAGARFFPALARKGMTMAKLAVPIVLCGAGVTLLATRLLDIPTELAVGLFAGALTSTPALAAALEGASASESLVSVGYGIGYPIGVVLVVLFAQLVPRLVKSNGDPAASDENGEPDEEDERIQTVLVTVTNSALFGKQISESGLLRFNACQVARVLREDRLEPLRYDDCFDPDQKLLLVGKSKEIAIAIDYVGRLSKRSYTADFDNERQRLVVTSRNVAGRALRELGPLKNHGVIITRITRHDITFVPKPETHLESQDALLTVGKAEDLNRFAEAIGHRSESFDETDLLSLSFGMVLGIVVGMIPLGLPGTETLTLGMAGGPLLVALILGHFGRIGRLVGHIPRSTRKLLQEFGLVLFLADAGVSGGAHFVEAIGQYGWILFLISAAIVMFPMAMGFLFARFVLKLDLLRLVGGIAGAMTSTPALGALTAQIQSQRPAVSYATAYPIALVFMTVLARVMVSGF